VLDVQPDATDEVIEAAGRAKIQIAHTDKNGTEEEMMEFGRAADRLLVG